MSPEPALPDELSYLITSFTPLENDQRSKAFLTLSAFCQGVRSSAVNKGKQPDTATEALVKVFTPIVVPRLQDTNENDLLIAISFLTAVFQVDRDSASAIFLQDGVLDLIMDSVDLNPSSHLSLCVAHILSQAAGNKQCRTILATDVVSWLESKSHQSQNSSLRAAATIALIKLSKGSKSDNAGIPEGKPSSSRADEDELANTMKQLVITGHESSTSDAVEGLAYLSADPLVKEALADDAEFLKKLFALVPRTKSAHIDATLLFGVLVIISNLCTYRPQLSEEQAQIEKLKRMTKTAGAADNHSVLDDDSRVKDRVRKAVAAGVLDVFASAMRVDSDGVRHHVGKALLGIVTENGNRGRVLQSGGAKILMLIIKHGLPSKDNRLDTVYLDSIQALAKLTITSSPIQVFGPDNGAIYDAIRPFSLMLQHPNSTLLQRFEALMALTNVASHSPTSASKVAEAKGLMNKVELLLLEDHILIRRAAMELICNLIAGSDSVFERYGGGDSVNATKSKIQILVAMADVEDVPTRLAASGALATVTTAPTACQSVLSLQSERQRVFHTLTQLIDPTDLETIPDEARLGLVHRGVVCVINVFGQVDDGSNFREEGKKAGLLDAVKKVVDEKRVPVQIQAAAAEAMSKLTAR